MKFALIALACLVASTAFAAKKTFQVVDVKGRKVQVTAEALAESYRNYVKTVSSANQRFVNDDGSVTITSPRFKYVGQNVPFSNVTEEDSYTLAWYTGVCANFKLGEPIQVITTGTYEKDKNLPDEEQSYASTGWTIRLDGGGQLIRLESGFTTVFSITCKAK